MGRRGIIALGLTAVLGVAVCLLLSPLGLGRASSLATVVGLPIALVAMVASVLALKLNDARKPVAGLDTIADEMAGNIHDHWDGEAKLRGLHDRELPLVWQSVELLRHLARTGKVARSVGKQPPWTMVRGYLGDLRVRLQRSSP